jgi:hypothetical protein
MVEIPLETDQSLDGIIAYLTKKHGGNVHERKIVTITSSPEYVDFYEDEHPDFSPHNAADLTNAGSFFRSTANGRRGGAWICWDFGESRVRLSACTIRFVSFLHVMVQGSSDRVNWTNLSSDALLSGRQSSADIRVDSFDLPAPGQWRFIRMFDPERWSQFHLDLGAVEFFGTLLE